MAILSHADYNFRWTSPAPVGFNQTTCPPCYHEYIQREVYKQDYLDLFINIKTFERNLIDARYYVKVTGCPILGVLGIPNNDLYTIMLDGALYLLVDYDYPWTDEELKKKRCIKYIMIGEAAPQQNPKIVGYGVSDKKNSYYYNILHIKSTGYLTAPLEAFAIINTQKKVDLLKLANASSILLDIFPFALNYKSLRDHLNISGVSEYYFQELMDSINHFKTKYNCNEEVKGVFVAPPTISHWLANIVDGGLTVPIIFRLGNNTFIIPHFAHSPLFYQHIPAGTQLVGIGPLIYLLTGLTKTPILASCAYGTTGLVPHYIYIKSALGLP
jgi:hypothetical protein